jgi:mannose-1-phosphate guanylyltransferase/phosphomannomutase
VRSSRAAFGVRFDRTAERLRLVDDRGDVVADDRALLLLLDLVAAEASGGVVALPASSTRVAEQVAAFHGTRIRWTGVGPDAFARMPGVPDDLLLAGDGAGSFIIPAVARTPDALAAFARLVALVARTRLTLSEIDDRIPDSQVVRADIRTPWAVRGTVMRQLSDLAHQRPGAKIDLTAGIKVIDADGSWCLMLPDPAEAVLHLWAEASTEAESSALLTWWTQAVTHAAR